MKRIIILFLAIALVVPLVAQEGDNGNEGFKRGYKGIVEIGFYKGFTEYSTTLDRIIYFKKNALKLHVINGYKINPSFFSGIGIGYHYIHDSYSFTNKDWSFPIFAYFRGAIENSQISPYLSIGVGTTIFDAGEPGIKAGYFINPKAGISYKINKKLALELDLGYDVEAVYRIYSGIRPNHAISLNLGLSF